MAKSIHEQIEDMNNNPELNKQNSQEAKESFKEKNEPKIDPWENTTPLWKSLVPKNWEDRWWNFVTLTGGTIWIWVINTFLDYFLTKY
jgi:hypothetical protein